MKYPPNPFPSSHGKMRKICWCIQFLSLSFSISSVTVLLCQSAEKFDKPNAYLVVPDLNQAVICTRNEIGLVSPAVIVNAVHSFLVAF